MMFDDLRERAAADFEELEPEESPSTLAGLSSMLAGLDAQQRFILAVMLLLNVIVIGCMCLVALGRIQF
jgi:hypothetical protein